MIYIGCNKLPYDTVGWTAHAERWGLGSFGSSNPEGSIYFFPFSKFLSLVSFLFFRVRFRFRFRFRF